uniref:Inner nuclear membrane protein Man1 n=1 Tax=Cyprinus carpio TaxID=7962 RepID=A0A8C1W125_CYPCA
MASAQLTDEELVSELKRLGFTPGPVTESTRPVYLKKLKKLWEEQPQPRSSRSGKGRSSSGSINSNGSSGDSNSNAAARAPGFSARPPGSDVTRLSASRSEKRRAGKFVLGFSSDESDVEAPQKKGGPTHGGSRRDRGSAQQTPTIRPTGTPAAASLGLSVDRKSISGSPWWADRGKPNDLPETERDSRALNGNKALYESNSSKLARDYSDSDEEEEEEGERDRPRERRLTSRHSPPAPSSPYRSVWSSEKTALGARDTPDFGLDMIRDRRDDDEKEPREFGGSYVSHSYPKLSGIDGDNNSSSSSPPGSFNKKHLDSGDGESPCSSSSRFSIGLRPRFPSYTATYRANHSNHTGSNNSYSHASALKSKQHTAVPEDELLQQFKREEASATGGFSAHYLSMFLLTAACLFFVLLGLMYLRMRGSSTSEGDAVSKYEVLNVACVSNVVSCIPKQHFGAVPALHPSKCLKSSIYWPVILSIYLVFVSICVDIYQGVTSIPLVSLCVSAVFLCSLVVCCFLGRLIGADPAQPIEDVSEISRLESIHPRMSFFCRLRRAFFTVIHKVLFILAGIGVVLGMVYYMKYRWRKEEEETRQMYDMVERIIDVMRNHNEACQENKDLQQYLPIPHVRDSLVQPQDRKKMKKVWDRAVAFLSANESRIRTETQRIGGADFMVWRWLQPSMSPDKMSSMPSKVWQGQAFPLDRRNSPPNSLTPCLKIRNMFDPVMEVGENWHLAIQEAILEKCSDNDGIVHIAVDKNSREGCVYVKCLSAEHSGKAFKALHGSWFDGKLVTVKYLRLDRYHQRFPQALGCNTPLKPSNSSMNSMSRLNQRSSTSSSLGFS